ncbi:MAG: NUDIX domain-containing protein [Candidatus Falkowbacteria bacterium]
MKNKLTQEIEGLLDKAASKEIALIFKNRLKEGDLTRDENAESHFCAYFAACDYKNKQLFIGHHIKSGLWLFNGGHIDEGENLAETVAREIEEEWGLKADNLQVNKPALLTLAEINNPTKQKCRLHLDIWHFINVNQDEFNPDPLKIAEEFYSAEWMDLTRARQLVTDEANLQALDFIEANYFGK